MESITYSGFILKHTKLDPNIFFVFMVASGSLLMFLKYKNKIHESYEKIKKATIFSVFLFVLFITLKFADRMTYANFVFSKIHIQPTNLLTPLLISFFLLVVLSFLEINYRKMFTLKSFITLAIFLVIGFNLLKIYRLEWWAFQFIVTHPSASYDDKMRRAVGSEFYNFTQFINRNTPENSLILIPPQAFPWPQSGNEAFMRYFIYPRKMSNGEEYEPITNLNNYDYVVLNWGETDSIQPPYTHGWPKFDVPAEKTIFMNSDGTDGIETKGNFYFKKYEDRKVWGLIVVKH